MPSRLKNILNFTAVVASGGQATLIHGLNVDGRAATPDKTTADASGFVVVTVTATNITVQNNNTVDGNCNVFVEHWHTFERDFGDDSVTVLAPVPIVLEKDPTEDLYNISVKDHGAVGDGTTNDSAAIQAAFDAAELTVQTTAQGVTVQFPPGRYRCEQGLTLTEGFIVLRGAGTDTTQLIFAPTLDNQVLLNWDRGAVGFALWYCGLQDMSLVSPASALTKTALITRDWAEGFVHNLGIGPWTGNNDSVGWEIRGREAYSIRTVTIHADRPIRIREDTNTAIIDLDHTAFHNLDLTVTNGVLQPCIEVDTGLLLFEIVFDGYQVWTNGTHGFVWIDTTSIAISDSICFYGVCTAQGADLTSYSIYIDKTGGSQLLNLSCDRGQWDPERQGAYLRNISNVALRNLTFDGALNGYEFLDLDDGIVFLHQNLDLSGGTATIGAGYFQKLGFGRNNQLAAPLSESGFWADPLSTRQAGLETFSGGANKCRFFSQSASLANAGFMNFVETQGRLVAHVEVSAVGAVFREYGAVEDFPTGTALKYGSANFTITANTAGKLNVFNNGTYIRVQNLLGETVDILVTIWMRY